MLAASTPVVNSGVVVRAAEVMWSRLSARTPSGLDLAFPASCGIVLSLGVVWSDAWHPARNVITWVHELGHAAASLLTGGNIRGIKMHRDTSGETIYSGRPGLRAALVAFAGHPAPAILSLTLSLAARAGFSEGAVAGVGLLALLTLPLARTFWAVLVVFLVIAAVLTSMMVLHPVAAAWMATLLACFLLAGSLKGIIEEQQQIHDGTVGPPGPSLDTLSVARRLHMPAALVVALWLLAWGFLACLSALLLYAS